MIKTQRVFIALWPPPPVRAALARVAAGLIGRMSCGRVMPAANLHMTLAFIGKLEEDRVAELARLVERCRSAPFSWRLDRLGAFERARVLWAGGEVSEPLNHLAESVRSALDQNDFDYDPKPFAPHVTLVRDARKLPQGAGAISPPIDWQCEQATLVRSVSGSGGVTYLPLTNV